MKQIKKITILVLLIIPCLMQAQITYHYSMGYDANGSRISRLLLRKLDNPVTGTDSAVIAVADSALLNAINAGLQPSNRLSTFTQAPPATR